MLVGVGAGRIGVPSKLCPCKMRGASSSCRLKTVSFKPSGSLEEIRVSLAAGIRERRAEQVEAIVGIERASAGSQQTATATDRTPFDFYQRSGEFGFSRGRACSLRLSAPSPHVIPACTWVCFAFEHHGCASLWV